MAAITQAASTERWRRIDPRPLGIPAALIFNPHAGQKLGIDTNAGSAEDVQSALRSEGIAFDPWLTTHAGHATELARKAVEEGRQLVIAAGGDGTVNEIAHGLANSDVALGLMPLGSIMNVARTLWIPRDLPLAARTIAEGKVLAMDMGRSGDHFFLEAAGVGLDAGLFGYFDRLESGASRVGVLRAAARFLRQLGSPRVTVEQDGGQLRTRAPMVSVANGPYVGAAYAIAPEAHIDDGLLEVVVCRHQHWARPPTPASHCRGTAAATTGPVPHLPHVMGPGDEATRSSVASARRWGADWRHAGRISYRACCTASHCGSAG
jgi:YegS/Rv2252/BmrU family lipid kinase